VLSEGTGGEVRASGFLVDAAGKTGTTTTCATPGSSASRPSC